MIPAPHSPRARPRSPRPWVLAAVILLAGALGGLGWLVLDYMKLRSNYDRLAGDLERLEARGLTREEIQTRLAEELAYTRATVSNLMRERSLGRALLEEHADQVCLIHVAYRYVDARTGLPMALARPGPGGSVVLIHDVFGTAFPVAPKVLLSNRHVLEPWWESAEARTNAEEGFIPQRTAMRAFCPGLKKPLPLQMLAASPRLDLATAHLAEGKLDPLPIAPPDRIPQSGFSVFLMGYPTGLDAALARMPEQEHRALLPLLREAPGVLADSLMRKGLIRPLLTHGRISEIRPEQITFDAPTARGSSGGPLFNVRGEVIGVSTAILKGFSAANFAIPLDSRNPLLPRR